MANHRQLLPLPSSCPPNFQVLPEFLRRDLTCGQERYRGGSLIPQRLCGVGYSSVARAAHFLKSGPDIDLSPDFSWAYDLNSRITTVKTLGIVPDTSPATSAAELLHNYIPI